MSLAQTPSLWLLWNMLVQSRKQFYMGSHKITHSCSHNKLWLQLCVILCDTIKITSCSEQTIFHNNHKHYCSDYIYKQMVLPEQFTLLYNCSPLPPPSLLHHTLVYEQKDISSRVTWSKVSNDWTQKSYWNSCSFHLLKTMKYKILYSHSPAKP